MLSYIYTRIYACKCNMFPSMHVNVIVSFVILKAVSHAYEDDMAAYIWNIKDIAEWLDDEEVGEEEPIGQVKHSYLLHQVFVDDIMYYVMISM